ncbi:sensor histidine kinase [Clostridium sp. ATCC 25772]|uniref:sensor histidine kinase n=1 Tax=Clostridium sp. ATCC 25772 TaxID=1676991 RepID=UPI0007865081|nr:sensor histidine kinase [Clostridium sp. ATCC 25772]
MLILYIILLSTIIYRSFINISNIKFNIEQAILILALIDIITISVTFFEEYLPTYVSDCLPIIIINISLIIVYYIKNKKLLLGTMTVIFSTITFVIGDYVVDWIKIGFFNVDLALNIEITYTKLLVDWIMVYVAVYFISYFVGKLFRKNLSMIDFYFKFKTSVLVLIILSLTLLIYYVNIILNESCAISNKLVKFNGALFLIYFITLILIIYSVLITVRKELQFENDKIHLKNLREYTSNLESVYAGVRKFRHDYINIISSMAGYIDEGDMVGLKKFFNENIAPLSEEMNSNNFKLCVLKNIEILELKGIVSSKMIVAKEKGINLSIDVFDPIKEVKMNILDLCRVVGIILDNAIEASLQCEKPFLKLGIIKKKRSILIIVINNYKDVLPPISKLFLRGFSTKGANRGLGLSNLREVLDKYENVIFDIELNNGEFMQTLEIYSMGG